MAIQSALVPIKIECGCGQRYAFDVESSSARMSTAVCCPICGADGTQTADAILAQRRQSPPPADPAISISPSSPAASHEGVAPIPPSVPRVSVASIARVATSPAPKSGPSTRDAVPGRARMPGQLDPEQASREARAKVMWGDDPAEVTKFLKMHGFSTEDAQAAIAPLLAERKDSVRKAGIAKILQGAGMACLPIIAWFFFKAAGYLPLKIFSFIVAVGVWGVFRALT